MCLKEEITNHETVYLEKYFLLELVYKLWTIKLKDFTMNYFDFYSEDKSFNKNFSVFKKKINGYDDEVRKEVNKTKAEHLDPLLVFDTYTKVFSDYEFKLTEYIELSTDYEIRNIAEEGFTVIAQTGERYEHKINKETFSWELIKQRLVTEFRHEKHDKYTLNFKLYNCVVEYILISLKEIVNISNIKKIIKEHVLKTDLTRIFKLLKTPGEEGNPITNFEEVHEIIWSFIYIHLAIKDLRSELEDVSTFDKSTKKTENKKLSELKSFSLEQTRLKFLSIFYLIALRNVPSPAFKIRELVSAPSIDEFLEKMSKFLKVYDKERYIRALVFLTFLSDPEKPDKNIENMNKTFSNLKDEIEANKEILESLQPANFEMPDPFNKNSSEPREAGEKILKFIRQNKSEKKSKEIDVKINTLYEQKKISTKNPFLNKYVFAEKLEKVIESYEAAGENMLECIKNGGDFLQNEEILKVFTEEGFYGKVGGLKEEITKQPELETLFDLDHLKLVDILPNAILYLNFEKTLNLFKPKKNNYEAEVNEQKKKINEIERKILNLKEKMDKVVWEKDKIIVEKLLTTSKFYQKEDNGKVSAVCTMLKLHMYELIDTSSSKVVISQDNEDEPIFVYGNNPWIEGDKEREKEVTDDYEALVEEIRISFEKAKKDKNFDELNKFENFKQRAYLLEDPNTVQEIINETIETFKNTEDDEKVDMKELNKRIFEILTKNKTPFKEEDDDYY